jgi:hypothetical protein
LAFCVGVKGELALGTSSSLEAVGDETALPLASETEPVVCRGERIS